MKKYEKPVITEEIIETEDICYTSGYDPNGSLDNGDKEKWFI